SDDQGVIVIDDRRNRRAESVFATVRGYGVSIRFWVDGETANASAVIVRADAMNFGRIPVRNRTIGGKEKQQIEVMFVGREERPRRARGVLHCDRSVRGGLQRNAKHDRQQYRASNHHLIVYARGRRGVHLGVMTEAVPCGSLTRLRSFSAPAGERV